MVIWILRTGTPPRSAPNPVPGEGGGTRRHGPPRLTLQLPKRQSLLNIICLKRGYLNQLAGLSSRCCKWNIQVVVGAEGTVWKASHPGGGYLCESPGLYWEDFEPSQKKMENNVNWNFHTETEEWSQHSPGVSARLKRVKQVEDDQLSSILLDVYKELPCVPVTLLTVT